MARHTLRDQRGRFTKAKPRPPVLVDRLEKLQHILIAPEPRQPGDAFVAAELPRGLYAEVVLRGV